MFTKTIILTVSLSLIVLAGCGGLEEKPAGGGTLLLANPQPGVAPVLRASMQSACKSHGPETDSFAGGLTTTLEPDGTLTVVHADVEANCAAKIESKATLTLPAGGAAGQIAIEEWVTNPEQAADCICRFDVTTTIAGLAPGSYSVTALGPNGELAGPVVVGVATTLPTQQSACKNGLSNGPLGPSLNATVQGSSVVIEHLDVTANCAAKIASQATVTPATAGAPGTIRISEVITNPGESANCICRYDLKTTVAGLASGTYTVEAIGPGQGETAGPITVVVP